MLNGRFSLIDDLNPGDCFIVTYDNIETGLKETNSFIIVDLGPVIGSIAQEGEPDKVFVVDIKTGQLTAFDTGFEVYVLDKEDYISIE